MMRDEWDMLIVFVLGLVAVTLYLTTRYVMALEDRLDALALEFYRSPQLVDVEPVAG